jgi:hypothetical protein
VFTCYTSFVKFIPKCSILFYFGDTEFELGALCLLAGVLPLEQCPQAIFALVIFHLGSHVFSQVGLGP